jgi:hypothetical protein
VLHRKLPAIDKSTMGERATRATRDDFPCNFVSSFIASCGKRRQSCAKVGASNLYRDKLVRITHPGDEEKLHVANPSEIVSKRRLRVMWSARVLPTNASQPADIAPKPVRTPYIMAASERSSPRERRNEIATN